jgi:hypothetical protein
MVVPTLAFMVVRQVDSLVGLGPSPDTKRWRSRCCATNCWCSAGRCPDPRYTPADRMVLAALAKLPPLPLPKSSSEQVGAAAWTVGS